MTQTVFPGATKIKDMPLRIIDGDRGANYPKGHEFTDDGFCLFLSARNVTRDGFDFAQKQFITSEKDDLLRKGKLECDDVVLTTRGTVGNVALYDSSVPYKNVRINSGMVIIRCDKEKILPKYLYFVLKSGLFQDQVENFRSGSAQPQLPIRDMKNMKLPLPSLDEQENVVGQIGTIDEKIELNRQMNETLEQMGQALFRHYFIDNPEADKWGKTALGSRIKPRRGKSLQSKNMIPGDVPVVSGGLQPAGLHSESNTKAPVITVSASGANAGYIALWNKNVWSADSSFIDTTITPHVYFYYLLLSRNQKRIYEMQTGSGQPHIYPSHIELLELPNAPEELIVEFNNEVAMNFEKIEENKQEIQTLTALRDTLLPRLISGKVKVRD